MQTSVRSLQVNPSQLERPRIARIPVSREFKTVMWIALLHLPLGLILYNAGFLAIVHPIAAFVWGLKWALKKSVPLERVAMATAYFVGAEILWRMAKIPVLWEMGKYGTAIIMIAALLTRRSGKIPTLPLVYFIVLIPSCVLTFTEFTSEFARSAISFNMSGPFFLLVSCWFFSHVNTSVLNLRRILIAIFIPLLSVACVTLFYSVTNENIEFGSESNFATSGGYGPNQVSAILGLGVFAAVACLVAFKNDRKLTVLFGASALLFAAQSVLTFSRGGIYGAVGSIMALALFQFRDLGHGLKRMAPLFALALLFFVFIFPLLDDFTEGKLQERFEEVGTTNRSEIVQSDFQLFLANPILGIGVGKARFYRTQFIELSAVSHTEFSRLISEHGMFGLIALASLAMMMLFNIKRNKSIVGRCLVAGVCAWSILFMLNSGMRLAAPSFMWGIAFITVAGPGLVRKRMINAVA